ncbi:MAG: SDR family NAD(P)-dependent oxidoreductase [Oscillospiraceae bacterium]|jgi:short-subunit dehydrogenase
MRIAVITGASSGLGREFARQIGEDESLDEIWVIARREDKLRDVQKICARPIRPVPMDLTKKENIEALLALFQAEDPEIAYLVCAAGYGRIGRTTEIPLRDNDGMIDLNCRAAVAVTTVALPWLVKGSRVLEICSTAAFQPMPHLNVYAATKAFLQSYTKTLHYELLSTGIHVTAVCPYWIKDTEFIQNAQETDEDSYRFFLANHVRSVVKWALFDSRMNLWVSTPGPICMGHRLVAKFVPHAIMMPLMDLLRHIF